MRPLQYRRSSASERTGSSWLQATIVVSRTTLTLSMSPTNLGKTFSTRCSAAGAIIPGPLDGQDISYDSPRARRLSAGDPGGVVVAWPGQEGENGAGRPRYAMLINVILMNVSIASCLLYERGTPLSCSPPWGAGGDR